MLDSSGGMIAAVAAVIWLFMDIQKKAERHDWIALLKQVEVVIISVLCCVFFGCCIDMLAGNTMGGRILTGLVIAAVSTGYHKAASTAIAIRDSKNNMA